MNRKNWSLEENEEVEGEEVEGEEEEKKGEEMEGEEEEGEETEGEKGEEEEGEEEVNLVPYSYQSVPALASSLENLICRAVIVWPSS